MKWHVLAIGCAGLLAGCAEYGPSYREAGGYGASLTMAGGSGVRGVYPDAALYPNQFSATNAYAAGLMAGLKSGSSTAVGAPPPATNNVIEGTSGTSGTIAESQYMNPYAPTIELIVPVGFAAEADPGTVGTPEPVVTPTLPAPQPPATPQAPPVVPQPSPVAPPPGAPTPTPVPNGPGKPL